MDPAQAIDRRLNEVRDGMFTVGTVSGTATGNRVVVNVAGTSMTLPKLASYTATANDVVQIACPPGRWFVLGKIG